jgi:hypothetical protein
MDWSDIRRRSLQPGGFVADRVKLWYVYCFNLVFAVALTANIVQVTTIAC